MGKQATAFEAKLVQQHRTGEAAGREIHIGD
jgi:hypothetical protein